MTRSLDHAPPRARPGRTVLGLVTLCLLGPLALGAQDFRSDDPVLQGIWEEGRHNSHLYELGQALMDGIGPRLTGTPGLDRAHTWLEDRYREWGIEVEQVPYGIWERWESGLVHVDLLEPRRSSLSAEILAWSGGTDGPVEGPVLTLPAVSSAEAFREWIANEVPGAFVLVSFPEPTCRPDPYWELHASEESLQAMRSDREARFADWSARTAASGIPPGTLPYALEQAGAAGVFMSNWAGSWGTNRIFSAGTLDIPSVDLGCEDYGLLARLAEYGPEPRVRVNVEAGSSGTTPTFNTIARIRGTDLPEEYVVLSAHLDTWGGGTGATDNGTGTITMLEAMRILSSVLPTPRRTILVGHWGGEEQGLNGSGAFAQDHPEIVDGIQILLNQDNGTGRISEIDMQGFVHAADHFTRWLAQVPESLSRQVEILAPGLPDAGRSDHASFVCHGAPAFRLGSYEWDYRDYTWHTTRDTLDKIAWEEVTGNAILTAMLAYLASEDPERLSRETRDLATASPSGGPIQWPTCWNPSRAGP